MPSYIKIQTSQNYGHVSQHTETNRLHAIYVGATGTRVPRWEEDVKVSGSISTDEARELARELIAIADQFDRDAEENAKPKLPTEPGIYVVPDASNKKPSDLPSYALLILDDVGKWTVGNSSAGSDAEEYARQLTKNWGPLVRLYAEKP